MVTRVKGGPGPRSAHAVTRALETSPGGWTAIGGLDQLKP